MSDPRLTAGCGCPAPIEKVNGIEQHAEGCGLFEPDWDSQCLVCEGTPIVPGTGMCGPCTWGEAETIGGNW